MFGFNNQEGWGAGNSDRKVYACYPSVITAGADHSADTSNFVLQSNWYGYDASSIYNWETAWNNNNDRKCNGINSTGYSISSKNVTFTSTDSISRNNTSVWRGYSNYMRYTGGSTGFTSGLKTIYQDWTIFGGYSSGNNRNHYEKDDAQIIYIIDYATPLAKINEYDDYLSAATDYKEGGFYNFLVAFDKLTIDVGNAQVDYSTAPGTMATTIASTLNDGATTIASAYTGRTADVGTYATLRAAFEATKDLGRGFGGLKAKEIVKNAKLNATTVNNYGDAETAFLAAYNAAAAHMAGLVSNHYFVEKTSAEITALASTLNSTREALSLADLDWTN